MPVRVSRCRRARPTHSPDVGGGNPRALIEPLDFTDSAQVAAAWERVRSAWGGIDLVLVVAGSHAEIRAWDLTEANAMALLRTNLHGVIGTVATIMPALLAQGKGALGIVASVAGYRGLPKALIYGASKAALINFTETLYLDLHPKGFGVYLINPGFVKTPLTDRNEFTMPHLITAEAAATALIAGLRAGDFEIAFSQGVHAPAQGSAPVALSLVLRVDPPGYGVVDVRRGLCNAHQRPSRLPVAGRGAAAAGHRPRPRTSSRTRCWPRCKARLDSPGDRASRPGLPAS